jgi:DNA-binding CsgD family transcriptional regulator
LYGGGGARVVPVVVGSASVIQDASRELFDLLRPCGCTRIELTDREEAVLEKLAEGKSTREVAECLYVSHQAVTYHVGNLLAKFRCASRTGAVARAFVLGILAPTWPPSVIRGSGLSAVGPRACEHMVKGSKGRRTFLRS